MRVQQFVIFIVLYRFTVLRAENSENLHRNVIFTSFDISSRAYFEIHSEKITELAVRFQLDGFVLLQTEFARYFRQLSLHFRLELVHFRAHFYQRRKNHVHRGEAFDSRLGGTYLVTLRRMRLGLKTLRDPPTTYPT